MPGYFAYKNQYGQKLAHFYMKQRVCWDGTRITYLSAPTMTVGITPLGASNGWNYNGVAGRRDYYVEYKGNTRGKHVTSRSYGFLVCPSGGGCYEKRPTIQIHTFMDKTGYARAWG